MASKTKTAKDKFFSKIHKFGLALTYGDVRLETDYSEILPAEADLSTLFSRNIKLNNPIIGSPMDTVTEANMAIALAKLGGLGIIHKALKPSEQATVVAKVRYHLNGKIVKPIHIHPENTVEYVLNRREENKFDFHSFPVIDSVGKLVGIITKDDFDYCENTNELISQIMSKNIISAKENIGLEDAYKIMIKERKKILPLINEAGLLKGIYLLSDVKRLILGNKEKYNLDNSGSLQVGAAIGIGLDAEERLEHLAEKNINLVVIDTAHGDSKKVLETIKYCKKNYPQIDVVAGNVSQGDSAKRLAQAGADGLKIGQGPGSICTTRIIAGIGVPQVSAIYNCSKAVENYNIPVCADGGIEYPGDITIALAAGAQTVMLGKLLAGTEEAPGEKSFEKDGPYKRYRGMGSLSAMRDNQASRERYGQAGSRLDKLVAEGIDVKIPYKGEVSKIIFQLLGGLRAGMGYLGAQNIISLQEKARFVRITNAGSIESHPHTREINNYLS